MLFNILTCYTLEKLNKSCSLKNNYARHFGGIIKNGNNGLQVQDCEINNKKIDGIYQYDYFSKQ